LITPSNRERFLAVDRQLLVSKQIILVYFNPCDDQFVFPRWKLSSQNGSVENRVNGYLALIFGMDVRHVVLIRIIEKHSNEDAVKHRNCWHDDDLSGYAQRKGKGRAANGRSTKPPNPIKKTTFKAANRRNFPLTAVLGLP
jgi:hypothetical protein